MSRRKAKRAHRRAQQDCARATRRMLDDHRRWRWTVAGGGNLFLGSMVDAMQGMAIQVRRRMPRIVANVRDLVAMHRAALFSSGLVPAISGRVRGDGGGGEGRNTTFQSADACAREAPPERR